MSMLALKEIHSPALAPGDDAIDLNHLSRMTLGERSLEREVLALFVRQADILLAKMNLANPTIAVAAAHTLKGSAVGIGAWPVGPMPPGPSSRRPVPNFPMPSARSAWRSSRPARRSPGCCCARTDLRRCRALLPDRPREPPAHKALAGTN